MRDLDELALAMPQATKETSRTGGRRTAVHGKFFCFHRSARPDAVDPETGERLDDVFVFRVADLGREGGILLRDERGMFFTTPHWNGYSAVLMRIPDLERIDKRRAARPHRRGVADAGAEARREGVARRAGHRRGLTAQRAREQLGDRHRAKPAARHLLEDQPDGVDGGLASRPRELGWLCAGRPSWRTTMSPGSRSASTRRGRLLGGELPVAGHRREPHLVPGEVADRGAHPVVAAEERRAPEATGRHADLGE